MQQVTAREGRPIVICEKDDVETKSLAWQTIDVPHTVDCLQVLIKLKKFYYMCDFFPTSVILSLCIMYNVYQCVILSNLFLFFLITLCSLASIIVNLF